MADLKTLGTRDRMTLKQLAFVLAALWLGLVAAGIILGMPTLIHIGANIFGSITILLTLFLFARHLYRRSQKK